MAFKKAVEAGNERVVLTRLQEAVVQVAISGITPVIPHKWSKKSLGIMPGAPGKSAVKEHKGPKNPEEEAEACLYYLPDGQWGIKATAFKAAMVSACRSFEKIPMVRAKTLFFVEGIGPEQLVAFTGTPVLHEDTPRNANGTADLRYRYYFEDWKAVITINYLSQLTDEKSVINLLDAAGREGVGDWRPSAPKSLTGIYGRFRVDAQEEPLP